MTSEGLIRAAFPAAAAGAVIGVAGDLYHFTIDDLAAAAPEPLFKVHGLLLVVALGLALVALAGISLHHGDRSGRIGRAGTVIAFAGTTLVLANVYVEGVAMPRAPEALTDPQGYALAMVLVSYALLSLGWLLIGIATARSGLAPRRAAILLCVGAVIAFGPLPGSYILLLLGVAATARSLALAVPGVGHATPSLRHSPSPLKP